MAVDDLWFSKTRRDADGNRVKLGKHGRGKRWRVRNPGYPEQLFARETDANRLDLEQNSRIVAGQLPVDHRQGAILFEDYAVKLIDGEFRRGELTENSYRRYMVALKYHLIPFFGGKEMRAITADDAAEWKAWLQRLPKQRGEGTIGEVTQRLAYVVGGHVFKVAGRDHTIQGDHPFDHIDRIEPVKATPVDPWSAGMVSTVLSHIPDRGRGPAVMAVTTGVRPGESYAFALSDFAVPNKPGLVRVRHQLVRHPGKPLQLVPVKGGKERFVPLPNLTVETVSDHVQTYGTLAMRCECHGEVEQLAFHDGGVAWSRRRYTWHIWDPAVAAAGIGTGAETAPEASVGQVSTVGPGFSLTGATRPVLRSVDADEDDADTADMKPGMHQLRHYYASAEIESGVGIEEVSVRLGHASSKTTRDHYHHLFAHQNEAAARRVNARVLGLIPATWAEALPQTGTGL